MAPPRTHPLVERTDGGGLLRRGGTERNGGFGQGIEFGFEVGETLEIGTIDEKDDSVNLGEVVTPESMSWDQIILPQLALRVAVGHGSRYMVVSMYLGVSSGPGTDLGAVIG